MAKFHVYDSNRIESQNRRYVQQDEFIAIFDKETMDWLVVRHFHKYCVSDKEDSDRYRIVPEACWQCSMDLPKDLLLFLTMLFHGKELKL